MNKEELQEEVLIKVKTIINKYYEKIGRFGEVSTDEIVEVIDKIDELLNSAKLDRRKLILNKLEDKEEDE